MTNAQFDQFVDLCLGDFQLFRIQATGAGLDRSSRGWDVMLNPMLDLRGFERRGEDFGEAIEELVAGIVYFVDEGDWV